MDATDGQLIQFLSTRIATGPEFPDAEFLTLPPPEFYGETTRVLLSQGQTDSVWWRSDPAALEKERFIVIRSGGGMFENNKLYVVSGLADVLAERGPFPSDASLREDAIRPEVLLPVAEVIFSTVSIPISKSPIRGSTLADLMALAGGIDF